MSKATQSSNNSYPEIEEIKNDLNSLRTNVVELTKHIKENGSAQTEQLKKAAFLRLGALQDQGLKQLHKTEKHIKDKPTQSVALAFAAGVVASFLFGRRG